MQSAFVYEIDCLDSHESVLFFPQYHLKAVYLPLPFPIMFRYIFHYFPAAVCLFCLQAAPSCISPVSNSALSSRDDALGPLYHVCFVNYSHFLFTGWSRPLNPLPSPVFPSIFIVPCVSCCPISLHSCFSLHLKTAHLVFFPAFPLCVTLWLFGKASKEKPTCFDQTITKLKSHPVILVEFLLQTVDAALHLETFEFQ